MDPRSPRSASLCVAALLAAGPLGAQTLSLGSMTPGRTAAGEAAEYAVRVDGSGFLTVAVRSDAGEDVRVLVTDDEYQPLPDGAADFDLGGDVGAEQLVVVLPGPGTYRVLIESWGTEEASFQVGGSFLPAARVATEPDPDGKPSGAVELAPGADHEDTLTPGSGDLVDWYRITLDRAGTLTVLTRADDGDLRLELFRDGEYREPLATSDEDQGGVLGNESVTVDLEAGQTVRVRVGPSSGPGRDVAYRIATGLIGG